MKKQITDKKLRDKRFRRTEEAIILAFFSAKEHLCPEHIIKIAHISRSTLYRHHSSLQDIAPDYEEYIMRKYRKFLSCYIVNGNMNPTLIYHRILVFISVHRILIKFLQEFSSTNVVEQMILELTPLIDAPEQFNEETAFIYSKEVSGVIEKWASKGFDKEGITPTVQKICYLTETASRRLKPLTIRKL